MGLALDVDDGREEDPCAGDIGLSPHASAMGSCSLGVADPISSAFRGFGCGFGAADIFVNSRFIVFARAKNPSKTCSDFVESVQKNLKRATLFARKVAQTAKNDLRNVSIIIIIMFMMMII